MSTPPASPGTPLSLRAGVFPLQWLQQAAQEGWITASGVPLQEDQFQPASLDLRLGPVAYRIRSSFLPGRDTVAAKLESLKMYEIALTPSAILERGHAYLIPLLEDLALPPYIHGKADPKSSTGRLDIFTRVLTDAQPRFDDVRAGYHGKLYLEVFSRSFTIKVHQGLSLNQLRLFFGDSRLDSTALRRLYAVEPLLYDDQDRPLPIDMARLDDGLFLGVDIAANQQSIVGYKAKKNSDIIDLAQVGCYDPVAFWEPLYHVAHRPLILEPEEFYILASKEKVCIPPAYAAELMAYDTGSGELRTHYAGFFDPGFGYRQNARHGTKAVLEVRPHDVPFQVEDGQLFCKLCLDYTVETPRQLYGAALHSHYQAQGLTLSKQFLPWPP
jgi:dCTP deaminase